MKLITYIVSFVALAVSLNLNAQTIDLSNYKSINGKSIATDSNKYIYVFLSSSCPCSKGHLKHLSSLQAKFKDFRMIGIKTDIRNQKLDSIEKAINFPIIFDTNLKITDQFKALKTPHTFVSIDNKIVYAGGVTNSNNPEFASKFYLKNVLTDIKNGKKPRLSYARAVGCYIQR